MGKNVRNGVKSVPITVRMDPVDVAKLDRVLATFNEALKPGEKEWTRSDVLRSGFLDNYEIYSRPPVEILTPGLEAPVRYITILLPPEKDTS